MTTCTNLPARLALRQRALASAPRILANRPLGLGFEGGVSC